MKIFLYSRDPGGANTIVPMFQGLKSRSHQVKLYGKDMALKRYRFFKLKGLNIEDYVKDISIKGFKNFLKKQDIDCILTSTSNVDFSEKYLWEAAKQLSLPCFAILDQWINYGVRFSKYNSQNLKAYKRNKHLIFLPNKIFVMDEYAKEEAIKEGLAPTKVVVTGQPYFELLMKRKKRAFNKDKLLKTLNIDPRSYILTFASEPLSTIYKKGAINPLGYNEQEILLEIVRSLKILLLNYSDLPQITLIIRPHPKDNPDIFKKLITSEKHPKIKYIIDEKSDGWDIIESSDLICGMGSMFLIESIILEKPILSIQIGLSGEDPFILSRRGIIKSILKKDDLIKQLEYAIVKKTPPLYNFKIIQNPVENITNFLEKNVCIN